MNKPPPSLESLLKLLTDEDDIARVAMVQLLCQYGHESDEILLQLQECDNPILRKRSHQMQALLTFKQRRFDFFNILHRRNCQFMLGDILQMMHLIWFDQDSSGELEKIYIDLLKTYPLNERKSLVTLADFMKNHQFIAFPDSTANGNHFMLGAVIDSQNGSCSFFAALMLAINEALALNLELQIINFEGRFYIYSPGENLLCDILSHWQLKKLNFSNYRIYDHIQLLKFMISLCFCNAVHSDSFRYIQIIGELLSPANNTQSLPFPYGGMNTAKTQDA